MTAADFEENVTCFRRELKRVQDSIAWTNDFIGLREPDVGFFSCRFTKGKDTDYTGTVPHQQGRFNLLLSAFNNVITDANADALTQMLKDILEHLEDITCRLVKTLDDHNAVLFRQYEAALSTAKRLEPFCEGRGVESMVLVKQTMELAMIHIQRYTEQGRERREPMWPQEELDQLNDEVQTLQRECFRAGRAEPSKFNPGIDSN